MLWCSMFTAVQERMLIFSRSEFICKGKTIYLTKHPILVFKVIEKNKQTKTMTYMLAMAGHLVNGSVDLKRY